MVFTDSFLNKNSVAAYCVDTFVDPESFFRGDPKLTKFFFSFFFLVDEWIQIPHISGNHRPASKSHLNLNSVLLACQ